MTPSAEQLQGWIREIRRLAMERYPLRVMDWEYNHEQSSKRAGFCDGTLKERIKAHEQYSGRIEELEGLLREARYDINHDTINEDLADRITATLSPKEEPKTP